MYPLKRAKSVVPGKEELRYYGKHGGVCCVCVCVYLDLEGNGVDVTLVQHTWRSVGLTVTTGLGLMHLFVHVHMVHS